MIQMVNPFEGVRAVLFDLDGTLVETNIDFGLMKREMITLAERYDIPSSESQGLDILNIVDMVVSRLRSLSRDNEAVRARQEAFEKLEQIELIHCQDAHPIDSANDLLNILGNAGIKIGIVTRNCRTGVRLSTEKCGISADVLVTRDDVANTKPHPDHLFQALNMLGIPAREAIMIGDHWMDIQAGKAAGTKTIGFLRPDRPHDFFDFVQPDFIIRDLSELLAHIQRLRI